MTRLPYFFGHVSIQRKRIPLLAWAPSKPTILLDLMCFVRGFRFATESEERAMAADMLGPRQPVLIQRLNLACLHGSF
jgi:hypothetical protein